MKRIVLALALIASAVPASAAVKLPAEMLGTWCLQKNRKTDDTVSLYERKQECDQEKIVIGPDSYHSYEGDAERTEMWLNRNGILRLRILQTKKN